MSLLLCSIYLFKAYLRKRHLGYTCQLGEEKNSKVYSIIQIVSFPKILQQILNFSIKFSPSPTLSPIPCFWSFVKSPNLPMKEDSLFCFVVMRSIELGCFRPCSLCLWKALDEEGCMGLVP